MRIVCVSSKENFNSSLIFQGKTELFWQAYKKQLKNIPLNDTVKLTINDEKNFLGEGSFKKGYKLAGLKDYVVRIYKENFKKEDLNKEFYKPKRDYLNTLDNVVLSIPGKIDIVKKKNGKSLGIENYVERLQIHDFPPLRNLYVTREETLKYLNVYEQLRDFPITSFKKAYFQLKRFCQKNGYQFDILSPNNILIDTKSKEINLIDPVGPNMNNGVHGKNVDFSKFHGADSLYPTLCDFILHKEHLKNLTNDEKLKWNHSINKIISKCILAGTSIGLERNTNLLKVLYQKIDKFWQTNGLCELYDDFMNSYSNSINPQKILQKAIDKDIPVCERISAIQNLTAKNFNDIKPIFEQIIEAPHQPKVEFPEILNATLDKLMEYKKSAISIIPTLEPLFDKEIFCTTKRRLYNLFIEIQPNNKKFLEEIQKSSKNIFEKTLYKKEFQKLYNKSKKLSQNEKFEIKEIYNNSKTGFKVSKNIVDKLWISRTCTKTSPIQELALKNMEKAYKYIELNKSNPTTINNLVTLHKIILEDIKSEDFIIGRLRTPDTDYMIKKLFNIKETGKKLVNEYSDSKDVISDLKKLEKFIEENRDKMDVFKLATYIFSETIRIHPFLNANGRVIRLFVEQFLLSKGYRLIKWPEETLYRKIIPENELEKLLKENCIKKTKP